MTERKNSAEQIKKEFMNKGGIFVSKNEWDKILLWVYPAFESYLRKHPNFNGISCDFARIVWDASCEHFTSFEKDENGKTIIIYDEIYVRVNDNNEFLALHEDNGQLKEGSAHISEIIACLITLVHEKKITFEDAWESYVYRRLRKAE